MQSNNTNYVIQSVKKRKTLKVLSQDDGGENISNLTILLEKTNQKASRWKTRDGELKQNRGTQN